MTLSLAVLKRRARIQARADLMVYGLDGELTTDVELLINRAGISVEKIHLPHTRYDGSLFMVEEDGEKYWYITLNIAPPIVRQRFTLAHEMGHFSLKHSDTTRSDQRFLNEQAANAYASELLVPTVRLRHQTREFGETNITMLARCNAVSREMMQWRLREQPQCEVEMLLDEQQLVG